MHRWGEDFDWTGLSDAIRIASNFMKRWGRIGVHSKEKFGTARLYLYLTPLSIHSLIWPGYVSNQFLSRFGRTGEVLNWFDNKFITRLAIKLKISHLFNRWQYKVYGWGYEKALKKYPHLAVEIICMADHPDLIKDYYKIMYKQALNRIQEVEDRWTRTADFYERTMQVLGAVNTPEFIGFKSGLSSDDIKKLTAIVKEYEEFDKL